MTEVVAGQLRLDDALLWRARMARSDLRLDQRRLGV